MSRLAILIGLTVLAFSNATYASSIWGKCVDGAYRVGDEHVRFFAISYRGDLSDGNALANEVRKAIQHFNRNNITHRDNDYDGGFHQVQLGSDKIFVIGWVNTKTGDHAYMAMVPGTTTVRMNDGRYLQIGNHGWLRRYWVVNGHRTYLQYGKGRSMVKWQLGLE